MVFWSFSYPDIMTDYVVMELSRPESLTRRKAWRIITVVVVVLTMVGCSPSMHESEALAGLSTVEQLVEELVVATLGAEARTDWHHFEQQDIFNQACFTTSSDMILAGSYPESTLTRLEEVARGLGWVRTPEGERYGTFLYDEGSLLVYVSWSDGATPGRVSVGTSTDCYAKDGNSR